MTSYTSVDPLTLLMLGPPALDELHIAATHRRTGAAGDPAVPVFLRPVRTEAYSLAASHQPTIRKARASFLLGDLMALFDWPVDYLLLARFEVHLASALWAIAHDLKIVDGSSFVELSDEGLTPPVAVVRDNDVALLLQLDRERGAFRLTAAVVN